MALGRKTGGGSRKGKPNKATAELKDMILQAMDEVGGVEYLKAQALQNPGPFLSLLGKILPTQLTGKDGGAIEVRDDREQIISRILGLAARTGNPEPDRRFNGGTVGHA